MDDIESTSESGQPEARSPTYRNFIGIALIVCVVICVGLFFLSPINAANPAERHTIKVGELDREFLIYVPKDLKSDEALPLVFVFHGGNSNAKGVMNLAQFNLIADRENAIVVYPQGVGGNWNDGRINTASQAYREDVDDLAFFDRLLAEVSQKHAIDPKRIYLTGISNGGIFSHHAAANRSDKIAAIAAVVGGVAAPVAEKFEPTDPVSVLIIQGTADPLMPYEGGKVAGGASKNRGSVVSTDRAAQLWVTANQCNGVPEKATLPDKDPSDGCLTETITWRGGKNKSLVALYRVEGGGHTWPGGAQYLPQFFIGKVTRDFDSQTIWDFFESNPKR